MSSSGEPNNRSYTFQPFGQDASTTLPSMDLNKSRNLWDKADWATGTYLGYDTADWDELSTRYFWAVTNASKSGSASGSDGSPTSVARSEDMRFFAPSERILRTMLLKLTVAPIIPDDDLGTQQRRLAELVWRACGSLYDGKKGASGAFQVKTELVHPVSLRPFSAEMWTDAVAFCQQCDQGNVEQTDLPGAVAGVIARVVQGAKIPRVSSPSIMEPSELKRLIEGGFNLACGSGASPVGS